MMLKLMGRSLSLGILSGAIAVTFAIILFLIAVVLAGEGPVIKGISCQLGISKECILLELQEEREKLRGMERRNRELMARNKEMEALVERLSALDHASESYVVFFEKRGHGHTVSTGHTFSLRGIAVCAGCNVPLRSSITKGNGGSYHYYLCQTKGYDHYGKSIKRDKVEGDVGELIKSLQPTEGLMAAAKAMFRHIWEAKEAQAKDMLSIGKRKIASLEKDVDRLLDTITSVSKPSVIARCEDKIDMLEREKTKLAQEMASAKGCFEEKLEPVLTFLANPFKIWASGNINLRRLVLKLAFADRIHYDRFEGARTPEIAIPFKALGGMADPQVCFGAQERTRTSTSIRTLAPEASASTNSATWAGVVRTPFIRGAGWCQRRFCGFGPPFFGSRPGKLRARWVRAWKTALTASNRRFARAAMRQSRLVEAAAYG